MNYQASQTIIGLDVGRSAVKARAFSGGRLFDLIYPSLVSRAAPISDSATAIRAGLETVTVEGVDYFTGDTARIQGGASTTTGLSDDWIDGPEYQCLVLSTLKRLEQMGVSNLANPLIIVGTPANLFASQRVKLRELTQRAVPAEIIVLPQPMGSFLSHCLDSFGIPIPSVAKTASGRKRSWAVIDVGFFSTDFLVVREGNCVESKNSSCEGLFLAAEHLTKILARRNINKTLLECEEALRTKLVMNFGEKSIVEEVADASKFVVEKIVANANYLLSNEVASLDGVLLAGGGAPVLYASLRAKWDNVIQIENPRMSIVEGFLRYGKGVQLQKFRARSSQSDDVSNG